MESQRSYYYVPAGPRMECISARPPDTIPLQNSHSTHRKLALGQVPPAPGEFFRAEFVADVPVRAIRRAGFFLPYSARRLSGLRGNFEVTVSRFRAVTNTPP